MSGDPPVPRRGTFPLPSRRGGACPSRRFLERPRPAHPRSRTLCHGWSEPGAAVKWHRPKFCTAPGPSGPGEIIPGTIFCAPEILRKGIGVSPVNGGLGENELEPEGTCFRRRCESPGDPLVSFPSLGKKLAQRAKPSAWNETCPETGGRVRRPAPTGWMGRYSVEENRRAAFRIIFFDNQFRPAGRTPPSQNSYGGVSSFLYFHSDRSLTSTFRDRFSFLKRLKPYFFNAVLPPNRST